MSVKTSGFRQFDQCHVFVQSSELVLYSYLNLNKTFLYSSNSTKKCNCTKIWKLTSLQHIKQTTSQWNRWEFRNNFCYFSIKTCCGYSLASPRWGNSNEYPQHMFLWRTLKKLSFNYHQIPSLSISLLLSSEQAHFVHPPPPPPPRRKFIQIPVPEFLPHKVWFHSITWWKIFFFFVLRGFTGSNILVVKILTTMEMSHLMTKATKWLCAQRRLRSAWASAQSDQSLRCALSG